MDSVNFLLVTRDYKISNKLITHELPGSCFLVALRAKARGGWIKVLCKRVPLTMRKAPCDSTEGLEQINYQCQKSVIKMCLLVGLMAFPSHGKDPCLEVIYRNLRDGKQRMKTSSGIPSGRRCVIFLPLRNYMPLGNSPAVQGLGLGAFTAEGAGSIPGHGTKIPQAAWHGQKTKQNIKLTDCCDIQAPSNS